MMSSPNKPLTVGTRVLLTHTPWYAEEGVWFTLISKRSWDGSDWWEALSDKGETIHLMDGGEILSSALVEGS